MVPASGEGRLAGPVSEGAEISDRQGEEHVSPAFSSFKFNLFFFGSSGD